MSSLAFLLTQIVIPAAACAAGGGVAWRGARCRDGDEFRIHQAIPGG